MNIKGNAMLFLNGCFFLSSILKNNKRLRDDRILMVPRQKNQITKSKPDLEYF